MDSAFFAGEWRTVRLLPIGATVALCISDVERVGGWWVRAGDGPDYFYSVDDVRNAVVKEIGVGAEVWPAKTRLADVHHEPMDLTLPPG